MIDLTNLRRMAAQLGLPEDLWADDPPDEQETKIREFAEGLISTLEDRGMTLEDYLALVSPAPDLADPQRIKALRPR